MILKAFEVLSASEVVARLEGAGIANAQVNTMADLWAHEQLKARGRWRRVKTSVGEMPALLPPGSFAQQQPSMQEVPSLGQHTDAILSALGCSSAQIESLRLRHVI